MAKQVEGDIGSLQYEKEEIDKMKKFVKFAVDKSDKWKLLEQLKDDKNTFFEYMDPADTDGLVIARCTSIVNCTPAWLFKQGYENWREIRHLDKNCVEAILKEKIDHNHRLTSVAFSTPSPVWYREFVLKEVRALTVDQENIIYEKNDTSNIKNWEEYNKISKRGSIVFAHSINSEDAVRPKHVRGDIKMGGYYFEDIGNNQSRVINVSCMDIKGWIPKFVGNMMLKGRFKNFLLLKNHIQQQKD